MIKGNVSHMNELLYATKHITKTFILRWWGLRRWLSKAPFYFTFTCVFVSCFYKYLILNPWREFMSAKSFLFVYILFIFFSGDMLTYKNHNFEFIFESGACFVTCFNFHAQSFEGKKPFAQTENEIENCPKVKIIYWKRLKCHEHEMLLSSWSFGFHLNLTKLALFKWMRWTEDGIWFNVIHENAENSC